MIRIESSVSPFLQKVMSYCSSEELIKGFCIGCLGIGVGQMLIFTNYVQPRVSCIKGVLGSLAFFTTAKLGKVREKYITYTALFMGGLFVGIKVAEKILNEEVEKDLERNSFSKASKDWLKEWKSEDLLDRLKIFDLKERMFSDSSLPYRYILITIQEVLLLFIRTKKNVFVLDSRTLSSEDPNSKILNGMKNLKGKYRFLKRVAPWYGSLEELKEKEGFREPSDSGDEDEFGLKLVHKIHLEKTFEIKPEFNGDSYEIFIYEKHTEIYRKQGVSLKDTSRIYGGLRDFGYSHAGQFSSEILEIMSV